MNTEFDMYNFDGEPVPPEVVSRVKSVLDRVPFEGQDEFLDLEIYILYRYANLDDGTQPPLRSATGSMLCWDGRLDNRSELASALGDNRLGTAGDAEVVATAFDTWGTRAFGEFRGDWALSLWDPKERRVILAKDFLGARPLYYSTKEGSVRW